MVSGAQSPGLIQRYRELMQARQRCFDFIGCATRVKWVVPISMHS